MSFLFDKKVEHEKACEETIKACDKSRALFHAVKAAEFCFALAKQSEGGVAAGYVATAEGWLDIAEKIKKSNLSSGKNGTKSSAMADAGDNGKRASEETGESEFQVSADTGVSFDDIEGMQNAKNAIFDMIINPMRNPEKAKAFNIKPGGGVLLYGPPGNGKTVFGKAIAHEIEAPFFYASGAQIRSKWHGESEQRLSRLISDAKSHPVAVLFLDEIDGLLPRRTENSSGADTRLVTQFLSDIGGFQDTENILLILGATNKPWDIDEAVFRTGRFDEKIYIGAPDKAARLGMLRRSLKNVIIEDGLDLDAYADMLELYSGSDIVGLARKACQIAFRRTLDANAECAVGLGDLEEARKTIPSSITPALIRQYEDYNKQLSAQR